MGLAWTRLPPPFSDQIVYGARSGLWSFVVSYTPEHGWSGSRKLMMQATDYEPDAPWETRERAEQALLDYHRRTLDA